MSDQNQQSDTPLAYIAPPGSGLGFSMSGIHVETCEDGEALVKTLRKFKEAGKFRIIFVDEGLAESVLLEVEKINGDTLPAIVLLPDALEPLNVAAAKMKNLMIKAVGSDILNTN